MEGTKSGLPNPNLELYRHLMMRKIPLLFFNTYYPELEVPHVSLNDADTAYKAVRYLIEKGHQKIGAVLKLDDRADSVIWDICVPWRKQGLR